METLLSVCMIVKDEQDVLERCLKSIQTLADEIIIVDTGSTDSTKEIALKYTPHVYNFKWVNDFSAARNESLRYATGKWVLVLDADEYINTEDIEQYRWFLQETEIKRDQIYSISVVSYYGESLQKSSITEAPIPRLFPNNQGIAYYRPIHEQLTNINGDVLSADSAPFTVFHTGYLKGTLDSKNKSERNRQIFSALKEKSGFTPYDHFTIGNEHAVQGDLKKAIYSYERALAKATETNPWRWHCAFDLVNLYAKQDRLVDALEVTHRIFASHQHYPEFHCLLGVIYEYAGLQSQSKSNYLDAYQQAEKLSQSQSTFWLVNPEYGSTVPLTKLVHFARMENNFEEIVFYSMKLLQGNPYDQASLISLLQILIGSESLDAIIRLMDRLYAERKQSDYYMLFRVTLHLGHRELAAWYCNKIVDKKNLLLFDELKLALLEHDRERYCDLNSRIPIPIEKNELVKLSFIASLVFDDTSLSSVERLHPAQISYFNILNHLLEDTVSDEFIEEHASEIFDLLSELIILQLFDLFDQLLPKLQHSIMINMLAGYFYKNGQTELAIEYFNLLADHEALNHNNQVNFAMLYFKNKMNKEGTDWLLRAIEAAPKNRVLYGLLFDYCEDKDIRHSYKQKYVALSSQFSKIPVIQHL
ncbi:hypothetical protein PAT3040_01749 [Paenibacillus agaridevorans]|uniref:Glycosyltransferase 2-like domain-containing protein n=1 Tax=Paenibacillus agaridevorans TaxID=171404 RepID=A0A2R5EUY4_9BACL|nr:glycosyltransferase family 2 protein [Paenibacillus agaridevorans]GBG07201.1 hypothetical protein PAT3040_01749 [Paenibacillus agaridevorans]